MNADTAKTRALDLALRVRLERRPKKGGWAQVVWPDPAELRARLG
jgi:hypothetical protein